MMKREDYQRQLPSWIHLGDELTAPPVYGQTFECMLGERNDEPVPAVAARMVVRFLPVKNEEWRVHLESRLRKLSTVHLPQVVLPFRTGLLGGGTWYLLEQQSGVPLSGKIQAAKGLKPQTAEHCLRGVLTGLAALHQCELTHGDLRLSHVLLDERTSAIVWLVEAVLGGAGWLPEGWLPPDAARYYPPEWKGKTQQPTYQADLFACGMLGLEMYLGKRFLEEIKRAPPQQFRAQCQQRLKQTGASRAVRQLIRKLLETDPAGRPANAAAALEYWRLQEQKEARRWPLTALGVTVLIMLLTGNRLWSATQKYTALNQELMHVNLQKNELQREFNHCSARLKTTEEDNKKLEQKLTALNVVASTSDPHLEAAKMIWNEKFQSRQSEQNDEKRLEALHQAFQQAEPEVNKVGQTWQQRITRLYHLARRWFSHDQELQSLFDNAKRQPWDSQLVQQVEQRLSALEEAEKQWTVWVYDSKQSWKTINELIDSGLIGEEKLKPKFQILARWRDEIRQKEGSGWKIRLLSGAAPPGHGITRQSGWLVRGKWAYGKVHEWSEETSHNYGEDDIIPFLWKPGDKIQIILYGERAYYVNGRSELINIYFDSPLALWHIHNDGKIQNKDFVLRFEVIDCPGPPPRRLSQTLIPR